MTDPNNPMSFSVTNLAVNNQPIVYTGITASLKITLVNTTTNNIKLQSGNDASSLEIFMPAYFKSGEVQAMKISDCSQQGWIFDHNTQLNSLLFTYSGSGDVWTSNSAFTFNIINVCTNSVPSHSNSPLDTVQVNLNNLIGEDIPAQLSQNLALNNPPRPGNADLEPLLHLSLENQGIVYVSAITEPLTNTLYLNIKNIGTKPLYHGTKPWAGNAMVTVSFVYGNTAGSLTDDTKSNIGVTGSAWNISASIVTDETKGWSVINPNPTEQSNSPSWKLLPAAENKDIIGTGDQANVTFAFSNIESFTLPGHTQMYVQFSNFMADDNTLYNSAMFVLDIVKVPLPARGLINFYSPTPVITINAPQHQTTVPLRWTMYYVSSIKIICSIPGFKPITKPYTSVNPLYYEDTSIPVDCEIKKDTYILVTLQAFDNNGNMLNALQFTIYIVANFMLDKAGNWYPIITVNNKIWMAANLNYDSGAYSTPYNNDQRYRPTSGLLYTQPAAQNSVPDGWRMPAVADWKELLNSFGSSAFDAIKPGGYAGFNAQYGGYWIGTFNLWGYMGFYWTGSGAGDDMYYFFSIEPNGLMFITDRNPPSCLFSVRYIKDADDVGQLPPIVHE